MSTRLNLINILEIPELKSLLQVKFAKAASYGIDIKINIAEPVYNVAVSKEDLCRMIGILVDYTSRAYSQAYIFKGLPERRISVFHQDILFFETNTKAGKGIGHLTYKKHGLVVSWHDQKRVRRTTKRPVFQMP